MLRIDFAALCRQAANDGEFRRVARDWSGRLELVTDGRKETLILAGATVRRATAADEPASDEPVVEGADAVRLSASPEDWARLLAPVPPVGWHDVLYATGFTLAADVPTLARSSRVLRRLVELMRIQLHGVTAQSAVQPVDRRHDDAVGRYVYVDIAGVQYRVYYEQTGAGIPLLLQHTAGADSRQWRHLLEDREIQQHFRMIAYDLPYHGRSLPPTTTPWWEHEYRLSKAFLIEAVLSISRALDLDRPVFMGCSVGGMLAVDLAFHRPDDFRAVIGVNASLGLPKPTPREEAIFRSWAETSGDWRASCMLGRTSPLSPEAYRRETAWIYSQSAPPVHTGDLLYYRYEYDLTEDEARQIDTSRVEVYLLSGEYDKLAANGASARLARCIAGAHYEVVPGAGHFAPSENPDTFRKPLLRVLDRIRRQDSR